ncbi:MFS general substrate transporter [Ramicandelaber brevisporus]|nr:MFS general substrate transporter [Ramicandelaber brevisporus]
MADKTSIVEYNRIEKVDIHGDDHHASSTDVDVTTAIGSEIDEKHDDPNTEAAAPLVPPDGGFGWVVVAGCFFAVFASYGFLNSFGVYAEYYKSSQYKSTPSAVVGLIGTLQVATLNLSAPLSGWLTEHLGFNVVIALGGLIMAIGMVITSFATHIWMQLVFQGILTGLGASMVVTLAITVPAQWFTNKRGLATGIAFAGAGFGGVAFAPILRALISSVGIEWASRISGIIVAVLVAVSSLAVRRFLPPSATRQRFFDFTQLKDMRAAMFIVYSILFYGVIFIPFFYLPLFATRNGYSASTGSTLALLANLGSAFGRILGGFVSDRIGKFNTLILSISLALLSTLVLWLPFQTIGTAATYAVLYGIASGGQITMLSVTVAQVFGVARLQSMMGLVMAFGAVGVLPGTPGAGQLLDSLGHGTNFTPLIVYFAIVLALQLIAPIYLRLSLSKKVFVKY